MKILSVRHEARLCFQGASLRFAVLTENYCKVFLSRICLLSLLLSIMCESMVQSILRLAYLFLEIGFAGEKLL